MPSYKINHSSQSLLVKPIEKVIDDAKSSLILNISGRKLREYPKLCTSLELADTYEIDFSKNRLTEFPKEVCDLVSMERVDCHGNGIRTIPHEIVRLKALTLLDLSCNLLTQLPLHLCALLALKVLNLSSNKLLSLPDEIGCVRTLVELDVSCNEIAYLPPQIGNLQNLRRLNLRKNALVQLPTEMSNMKLVTLDVSHNKLTRISPEFRFIHSLVHLSLGGNPLEYPPARFCDAGFMQIKKLLEIEAGRRKASFPSPSPFSGNNKSYNNEFSSLCHASSYASVNGCCISIPKHLGPGDNIMDRYKMALSLDATPPHSVDAVDPTKVHNQLANNGFFSSIWNGCRPIITSSFKKGREGISEGATDSGYGTDICSSIPNIALENDNLNPSNEHKLPIASTNTLSFTQHAPLNAHYTQTINSCQQLNQSPFPYAVASNNLNVNPSLNPASIGFVNSNGYSFQGKKDKSPSMFDRWCSPFLPSNTSCLAAPPASQTKSGKAAAVPDLSKFLHEFLSNDNKGDAATHDPKAGKGCDTLTDGLLSCTHVQKSNPPPSTTVPSSSFNPHFEDDEFTRELQRQKLHYETKKRMAEKLRNEIFNPPSQNHQQQPPTHANFSPLSSHQKLSPNSNPAYTLSISTLLVPVKTSTCSSVSQQRRMANRSAPLARIESFVEISDVVTIHQGQAKIDEKLPQHSEPEKLQHPHDVPQTSLPATSICPTTPSPSYPIQTFNNGLSSPFKDPRISNLKRFTDTHNGSLGKHQPVTLCYNGTTDSISNNLNEANHQQSKLNENQVELKTVVAAGPNPASNSPLPHLRKISSSSSSSSSYKQTKLEREIELIREDRKVITKLREVIEGRLKVVMPEDLAGSLMDGVVLCHLVNHVKPHSISTIHVPSKSVPKLTLAKSKRNVENFLDACRGLGVNEGNLCVASDILEGRNVSRLARTVSAACLLQPTQPNGPAPKRVNKIKTSSPPHEPLDTGNFNTTSHRTNVNGKNGKCSLSIPSKISPPHNYAATLRRSNNQNFANFCDNASKAPPPDRPRLTLTTKNGFAVKKCDNYANGLSVSNNLHPLQGPKNGNLRVPIVKKN